MPAPGALARVPEWAHGLPVLEKSAVTHLTRILLAHRASSSLGLKDVIRKITPFCTARDGLAIRKLYNDGYAPGTSPWRACLLAHGLGVTAAQTGIGAYLRRQKFWRKIYRERLKGESRTVTSFVNAEEYLKALSELLVADGFWCRRSAQPPQNLLPWYADLRVRYFHDPHKTSWLKLEIGEDEPQSRVSLCRDDGTEFHKIWWSSEQLSSGLFLVDVLKGCRKL